MGSHVREGRVYLLGESSVLTYSRFALRVIHRVLHFPIATSFTALGMRLLVSPEEKKSCKATNEVRLMEKTGWAG